MRKLLVTVEDQVCDECAQALRRYIGNMEGIESVDVEERKIAIVFDNARVPDEGLMRITTESLEKLGHRTTEHWHVINIGGKRAA